MNPSTGLIVERPGPGVVRSRLRISQEEAWFERSEVGSAVGRWLVRWHRVLPEGHRTRLFVTDDHQRLGWVVSFIGLPRMEPDYLRSRRLESRRRWARYRRAAHRRVA